MPPADNSVTSVALAEPGEGEASPIEVSVVMPCLNEAATVGKCVAKAKSALEKLHLRGEIIVADNGSTDGSPQIAERMGARVVTVPVRGYGSALKGGIAAARGELIVMGDSDDSYDFGQIGGFVSKLKEGFELVMGNRFKGGIAPGAMPALHRYFGNPVMTGLVRLFFKSPLGDIQCGLRAFRRDAILRLGLRTTGLEFASEMVVKATLFRLRICEVPTTLSPDGRGRPPHMRSWRDGWRNLRFMLVYSPRWLFLYPGAILMLVGGLTGIWLLPGPQTIGRVTFDVHTLLYSAMAVLIGFQAALFAICTKVFGVTEGLLPEDPQLMRWLRKIPLEAGLVVGGVLMVIGLAASLGAVGYWGARHFGALDPFKALRLVIPGVVCLTLGFQIVLSSFFLGVLSMARR